MISKKKLKLGIFLVPTPLSLFKTSSHFGFNTDFLSLAWFGYSLELGILVGFKFNWAVIHFGDVWLVYMFYMFKYNRVLVNILPTSTSKRTLKLSLCCLPPSPSPILRCCRVCVYCWWGMRVQLHTHTPSAADAPHINSPRTPHQ